MQRSKGAGSFTQAPQVVTEAGTPIAQDRQRGVPQQRLHPAGQAEHAEPEPDPAVRFPADQAVVLEGGQQPVHHGAIDLQPSRQLSDGERGVRLGELAQDPDSPVQGLRGLAAHARNLSRGRCG